MTPDFARLRTALASHLDGRRALVVGDVMLDRYLVGEVARISPEAPVPVLRFERERTAAGGAANVATNLASLGLTVTLAGWTGDDPDRDVLLRALTRFGVDTAALLAVASRSTTSKTRVLAGQQQLVRIDQEHVDSLASSERSEFDSQVLALVDPSVDVVILSDYAKGVLQDDFCQRMIRHAAELGVPVLVDPKGLTFDKYAGAAAVTPNTSELAAACQTDRGDIGALLEGAAELRETLGLDALVVTRGGDGMSVLDRHGVEHVAAQAREVFDVSGAGDTAVATLAAARSVGLDWRDCAAVANVAAGLAVAHTGTVAVTRRELLDALAAEDPRDGSLSRKILDRPEACSLVERWRSAQQIVGFTNGCFDLLHAGHVSYLDWARRHCDRLVVGVNTDASVQEQKGPGRPVVAERERATVLAGLAAVDAVILFDEPTPIALIEALRPDVLIKGGDYREDEIVGASEVKQAGGAVLIAPFVEGESTTSIVDRVRDAG